MECRENTDNRDTTEQICELHDIPIINELGNGFNITWEPATGGDLTPRLSSKGLELNQEQFENCLAAIEEIKKKYYPMPGDYDYDEWGENPNGSRYLKRLQPGAGRELYMYVYTHEGEPRCTDCAANRLNLHNVDTPYEALFFRECLVEYLKYNGIIVPGIYSKIIRTEEHKYEVMDRVVKRKENILSFHFELPYEEGSENLIKQYLKNIYKWEAKICPKSIRLNNKIALKKQIKKNGEQVWVGKNVDGLKIIRLFNSVVMCNNYMAWKMVQSL
ncbi:MAG: hypothetical protein ACOX6Q_02685 [Candidatus Dojkabacteria bacterium]|jgi:hypothetical protein